MIERSEELHEELMKAFNSYFKAHQEWMVKGTRIAGMKTRYWLAEIRRIGKAQRKVIMEWRYDVDSEKRLRKAQKAAGQGSKTDN